ncbi:hypothetical protein OEZ85_010648 [Tetradesmus obliquus]|uniref:Methyltransferase small domain-containing protein n=1 Tax=Tetradesmus obliquus TaxID=3088 RepID=A0ABY8TQ10_TETOB|nr:hypothetical protein OEZ85_010648 [Tetradesmus obliquus]
MLLNMLFDDEDEGSISALFQVGDIVVQLKQRPTEGRVLDKAKEELQDYALAHPEESCLPKTADGEYDSAFPNVGLVVWQAGFVLGEWLLRAQPLGPWGKPLRVLELGCGIGQLGIVLALAGADVTLTDLAHITPLTQENADINASRCVVKPTVTPYMWGTPVADIQAPRQQQQQQQQQQEGQTPGDPQQQQQQPWDVIVAADVLYEPQYYDKLLSSLLQLCPAPPAAADTAEQPASSSSSSSSSSASPPIYMCYRFRKYDERGFEARAEAAGFAVTAVPVEELHADYQCGGYRVIRLEQRRRQQQQQQQQQQQGQAEAAS